MSKPRDAYHHGDLRNALVASAVRLIERGGEAAFSLREAARDVGVSANATYRHFDDRTALLAAAANSGLERLSGLMQAAVNRATKGGRTASPAIARFKAVGRAYVEFAFANPELYRLMFSGGGVGGLNSKAVLSTPRPLDLLSQSLDALVAEGVLPAKRRPGAELKCWSVVHGVASLALAGHTHFSPGSELATALESALDFTVRGLCAPDPPLGSRSRASRR
jgi:AcrR family transcriptional regulator